VDFHKKNGTERLTYLDELRHGLDLEFAVKGGDFGKLETRANEKLARIELGLLYLKLSGIRPV